MSRTLQSLGAWQLLACWCMALPTTGFAQNLPAVTIAQFVGPLAVTAESYPQLAAERTQTPVDLSPYGYVEEEYLISGTANVYDWATDGSVSVVSSGAPYTTRILVRKPADPGRFSGDVIVESVNNARDYDWAFIWSLSWDYLLERGDVFVAVTHNPNGIAALRTFDPQRYGSLAFANPNPAESCGQSNAGGDAEAGLRWDMFSQLGALLKSGTGPLAGYQVEYVFGTSHTREMTTYANSVHKQTRLADGGHVYDGFVTKSEYVQVESIRRCAQAPAEGDARREVFAAGVPVIRVTSQGDVLETHRVRREDSDDPADPFRLWEVAGSSHMDKDYYDFMPLVEDQIKAGQTGFVSNWPMNYACTPGIDLEKFPGLNQAMNAAFASLDTWVREGKAPPRAERIGLRNAGSPEAAFLADESGNAPGGYRSVYLEVPTAYYMTRSPGPGVCGNLGHRFPFAWSRLQDIYGNAANYRQRFYEVVDNLVARGWLTGFDARKMRQTPNPLFDP